MVKHQSETRFQHHGVKMGADVTRDEITLALLKEARRRSGLPLDFWVDLTDGLDQRCLEILVGRSSIFPKYTNSKDRP